VLNHSRQTGLLRLHHLREQAEAVGAEMERARPRFERLADPASAPRVVSSFNLFQTPEPLADRLAALADLSGRVLEPSAGLGRIYRAIRYRSACPVVLVDISPDCCRELYAATQGDTATTLVQADFLACDSARLGGPFDCVVMNPPFKMGTDIRHIRHALGLLRPGGRLVALCANGPRQRAVLKDAAEYWDDLPPGSFKESGTGVNAALIVMTR
jgi:SAM-dependent methyltransferase